MLSFANDNRTEIMLNKSETGSVCVEDIKIALSGTGWRCKFTDAVKGESNNHCIKSVLIVSEGRLDSEFLLLSCINVPC